MPPVVLWDLESGHWDLDLNEKVTKNGGQIEMDFLLPNGIFIPLQVDFYDSMENVKLVIITKCKSVCILLYVYQCREDYLCM